MFLNRSLRFILSSLIFMSSIARADQAVDVVMESSQGQREQLIQNYIHQIDLAEQGLNAIDKKLEKQKNVCVEDPQNANSNQRTVLKLEVASALFAFLVAWSGAKTVGKFLPAPEQNFIILLADAALLNSGLAARIAFDETNTYSFSCQQIDPLLLQIHQAEENLKDAEADLMNSPID